VKALEIAPALAARLLDELVYERVRKHVDVLELGWLESDLDDAIQRATEDLDDDARDDPPSRIVAASLIDRAWSRVEREWGLHRSGDTDCALCELDRRVRDEIRREQYP
jgi:hypothetical protein